MNVSFPLVGQASAPAGGMDALLSGPWLLLPIMIAMFYFMIIRPQQRKEKERRKMLDEVKSGDRVMFSGGILGTVANTRESILVIKIADNVKIEVARGAVLKVMDKNDKAEVDASA